MADVIPEVGVEILEIPTSLVLVGKTCSIFLRILNSSSISAYFKIRYEGSGIDVKSSDLSNKKLLLNPNSSEMDHIELIPRQKGLTSLIVKIFYLKETDNISSSSQVPSLDIQSPKPSAPSEASVFSKEFSPELAGALEEVLGTSEQLASSTPPSLVEPHETIEQVKEIVEEEIYSISVYLNVLDKESSKILREFAKRGDSNLFSTEMGLPLCICYFYSEIKNSKWKIRPALIRNTCIRMKEKFGRASYYLSYTLSDRIDESEINTIKEAMQTFILPHSSNTKPLLILNIDIIPELEKPSIIIGYEKSGIYEPIKNLLQNVFRESVDIFMDDSIFSGGLLYDYLVNWAGPSHARIVNLILSNNFIAEIQMFQILLETLASYSLGEL